MPPASTHARSEPFMHRTCPECQRRAQPRARTVTVGGRPWSSWGAAHRPGVRFFEALSPLVGRCPKGGGQFTPPLLPPIPAPTRGRRLMVPLDRVSHTIFEELLRRRAADVLDRRRPPLPVARRNADALRRRGAADQAGQSVGAGLVGVLYILDEPSIGLHPRQRPTALDLAACNGQHRRRRRARRGRYDRSPVDFGPGRGVKGGEVVAYGTIDDLARSPRA